MEREKLINLVTKAQSGDKDAMNTLFSEFYNDVYNFAYKTLKDTSLAEDITQETFLEIVRTIDKLSEPVAFVSWMKKIAYHQCTRYFKKKKDVIVDEDEDGNSIFDTLEDEDTGALPQEVEGYMDVQLVKQNVDMFAALTKDGTMVLDGESATNYDLSDWKDITDFDISCSNTVYSDIMNGEYVENSGCFFKNDAGFGTLHDPIISIFGVDKNGKVFYEGNNIIHDMSVVDGWSDITDVVAGDIFCAGLKSDGTVVLAGNNEDGTLDVSGFTNIKTK